MLLIISFEWYFPMLFRYYSMSLLSRSRSRSRSRSVVIPLLALNHRTIVFFELAYYFAYL